MFRRMARIDIVHVPYLGGTNLMTDLLAGRVDFFFGIPTNVLAQVRDEGIRALAATSAKRFSGARAADHGRVRIPGLRYDGVVGSAGALRHTRGFGRNPAPGDGGDPRPAGSRI